MLRIREVRRAKDITQVDFAHQVGVGQSAVSDWENGKTKPTLDSFIRAGEVLNCSLDYLAGLTDVNIVANAG